MKLIEAVVSSTVNFGNEWSSSKSLSVQNEYRAIENDIRSILMDTPKLESPYPEMEGSYTLQWEEIEIALKQLGYQRISLIRGKGEYQSIIGIAYITPTHILYSYNNHTHYLFEK